MLAQQAGNIVKNQRVLRGLTQEELARSAKVSRRLVSHLEQGKAPNVQANSLDRLFEALELNPQVVDRLAADPAHRQARLEQQIRLGEQRDKHLRLAIDLADDEQAASAMIAKAQERVALWKEKRSCSPLYIDRWSQVLGLPPQKMAKAMASFGDWENALFQNSPWSWAWN